jgi:hypothetical protein
MIQLALSNLKVIRMIKASRSLRGLSSCGLLDRRLESKTFAVSQVIEALLWQSREGGRKRHAPLKMIYP